MNRTSGRNGTATSSPLGTAPKHRERIAFTMSNIDNTAPENRDAYACVTAQVIKRKRAGRRELAHAVVQPLLIQPDQPSQQETQRGINVVCLWAALCQLLDRDGLVR